MKLIFTYPSPFEQLELFLATKVYDTIWTQDGERITEAFYQCTGQRFGGETIEAVAHDDVTVASIRRGRILLNAKQTIPQMRKMALVHALCWWFLQDTGLLTGSNDPSDEDEEFLRIYLFEVDVLRTVYGEEFMHWCIEYMQDWAREAREDKPVFGQRLLDIFAASPAERRAQLDGLLAKRTPAKR